MTTREQQFTELFPSEPSYRFKQIEQAFLIQKIQAGKIFPHYPDDA